MSEQDETDAYAQQQKQHALHTHKTWAEYWRKRGQPWRTEPEIKDERQAELADRLKIQPDLEEGIYPFKDFKLTRADVEWLLANHENGRGPVDWQDPQQRERKGIDLRGAVLSGVDLGHLPLSNMLGGLNWRERDRTPERRDMAAVHLEGAILSWTHLERAELYMAHMERADLYLAHLEGASLRKVHLEGASLRKARLVFDNEKEQLKKLRSLASTWHSNVAQPSIPPTDLRAAFFDSTTDLRNIYLGDERHNYVRVADIQWGGANLAVLDWSPIRMLGDERRARQLHNQDDKETSIANYREAMRANRQLAVALQGQGLNEEAAHYAYHAQRLQRTVLRLQGKLGSYLLSVFLDYLAGYGYKTIRTLTAYLLVIFCFTITYFLLGRAIGPHFSLLGALVFSLTSFHGRGFFPGGIPLDDPITVVAAFEAVIGLTIEISFIATFTQRFFGN